MAAANAVHMFRLVMSAGSPSAVEEPLKTELGPSPQPGLDELLDHRRAARASGAASGPLSCDRVMTASPTAVRGWH